MKLAALFIFAAELWAMHCLWRKYFRRPDQATWEDFLTRASLDDIIRVRHHAVSGFLALCLLTMGKLFDRVLQ